MKLNAMKLAVNQCHRSALRAFLALVLTLNFGVEGRCPPKELLGPCRCSASDSSITCYSQLSIDLKGIFADISIFLGQDERRWRTFKLCGLVDSPTQLDELEDNVFGGLQFENIYIRYTTLAKIHPNAFFSTYNYTKKLVLTSNRLKNCADGSSSSDEYEIFNILSKFPKITYIDLWDNKLEVVPERAFRPLHGQQDYLYHLKLGFNKITTIGDAAFAQLPKLSYLGLNTNKISNFSEKAMSFSASDAITEVNLFDNHLTSSSFPRNLFVGLRRPLRLILDHNRIGHLRQEVFRPFFARHGSQLEMNHNLLACGCESVWLLEQAAFLANRCRHMWCPRGINFWDLDPRELSERCDG